MTTATAEKSKSDSKGLLWKLLDQLVKIFGLQKDHFYILLEKFLI